MCISLKPEFVEIAIRLKNNVVFFLDHIDPYSPHWSFSPSAGPVGGATPIQAKMIKPDLCLSYLFMF